MARTSECVQTVYHPGRGSSDRDAHRQRRQKALRDAAAHQGELRANAVAEDVVGREADAAQVARARLVARGRSVDGGADLGWQGELRGPELVGERARGREAPVHLEVDVRHTAA